VPFQRDRLSYLWLALAIVLLPSASDYFTTNPQVMVAYVPMKGVHTIYATIGDLFAWLSVEGLIVLIGVALARRPKAGKAGAAEPRGEPLPVS
jgi:apolipoprotein N-acyltransferase